MGKQRRPWKPSKGPRGKPTFQGALYRKDCAACRVRERCTRSPTEARGLTLHPQAQHLALHAARERQHTERFKEDYKRRAGIEGTLSQAAFAFGMRRTRYRGLQKTHFHHLATAMAINRQRFVDWVWAIPPSKTRQSHFARLELAA
jgi:Transposase DDE domain